MEKREVPLAQRVNTRETEAGGTGSPAVGPYCTPYSAYTKTREEVRAVPIRCRTWKCPRCKKKLLKRLRKIAISGRPSTFITLTVNPNAFDSPADAAQALVETWWAFAREIRRRHPNEEFEYLAVFERTKKGWPHLHILARMPFVPQKYISEFFAERMNSPVVWIAYIRNQAEVVKYVSKYIAKEPHRFPGRLRHWRSRGYAIGWQPHKLKGTWKLIRGTLPEIAEVLEYWGYLVVLSEELLVAMARPPDYVPRYML